MADAPPITARTDWALILLLWLAGLGAAAQYGKVSVIFDRLGAVYPDAGAWLGFTVSLVGFVGILLGVAAGLLVARIRYRRALLWAMWVGAAISLYQATLPPLSLFLASRVIEGLSHLAIVVAAPTLIATLADEGARPVALTLWGTFFGVAFTALVWAGLPLADGYGLPALFIAHAAWMAGFALILARALPRVEAEAGDDDISPRAILRRHGEIYRSPFISAPGAAWLFYTLTYVSVLTLMPAYIAPEARALVIGAMPLVSIFSSMILGVWMLKRMPAVRVMQIGFALGAGLALALIAAPGNPTLCIAFAAALGLVQGAGFAAVPQLNESAAHRAQANGALAQTGNIGNTAGTPLLLAVIGVAGHTGFMIACAAILLAGIVVQGSLARRRAAFA
ncbi:MAG: MFS transporter [Pseudomonadota bacterium]